MFALPDWFACFLGQLILSRALWKIYCDGIKVRRIMGALTNCLSVSLYCKPPCPDQGSDGGYPSTRILYVWPSGYKKMLFKRRWDVSRGGKKRRIQVGDQQTLKINRAASDLVSLFLAMRHRQETDLMLHADTTCLLSLVVWSAYSIVLKSVPALVHPGVYQTRTRPPFPSEAVQAHPSYPEPSQLRPGPRISGCKRGGIFSMC